MIGEYRVALRETLRAELPWGPYALLDFPDHPNVGDSAIWLGELRLLRAMTGHAPAYVCRFDNCDWDWLDDFGGPILLHGGGNFGDIYPWYQDFREAVLDRFPGRRVIQLPQTLHFKSPQRLEKAARTIARHGNFLLCVRDERSLEIARRFDCDVLLLPDSAFYLDLARIGAPRHEVLYLRRTDEERATSMMRPGWVAVDWLDEPVNLKQRERLRLIMKAALSRQFDRRALRARLYRRLAEARLLRGVKLLSSGHEVVTDRLHAHILCTLMGVPHQVVDNSYGKLSGFMDTWKTDRPGSPARRFGALQAVAA
jgi:pyruvyl transferase EpsO